MQKAQQAEATTMADAVCASGRVSKEGRADLIAMCLSDRAKFLRMFPAQADKPAEKPADLTPDAKALLTGRVVDQKQHPATVAESDDADHMAESREADALAQKLLSEKKAGDYATAIIMASREVRAKRTDAALARLVPTA